jgi:hypothetical protein
VPKNYLHDNSGLYTSMTSSTCTTIVGLTLPWRALPAQQWWALHFHEELYLHNNGGLYTFWQAHCFPFPTHLPTPSSLPVPTGSWHQNLPQFLHKVKTSAVAFIGIMPTLGSLPCVGPCSSEASGFTDHLFSPEPTIHALYSKTSQVSFSLLIWPTN